MPGIGVIGYGYWGPNLVRNINEVEGARMVAVCDASAARLDAASARYPFIQTTRDANELIRRADIDAVAIATPVTSHFELAMAALDAGKHVFVEKPMTSTVEEAERLVEKALKKNLVLTVDHTFVYTGAVRQIRELLDSRAIGEVFYYDSVRVNLGLFQHDVNVIWDLAAHDLAIMDYVLPVRPRAVSATGVSHVKGQPENIAYLSLFFDDNLIAHIHVNWLAPVKIRRTLVGGSRRMIVYDDLEPSEKVKVYDKGIDLTTDPKQVYEMMISYRIGDMWAPRLDMTEALSREASHFVDCINGSATPISGGDSGLQVVRILEAATASMKQQGRLIELDYAVGVSV